MNRTMPGAGLLRRHRSAAPVASAAPSPRSGRSLLSSRARKATVALTALATLGAGGELALVATSGGASASTVAITPLTPGKTLSGVIGKGGQSAVNSFASWRGRSIDVVVNYLGANSWNAITNVSGEALTHYWDGSSAHRVWSVPMLPLDGSANLQAGARGDYDSKYKKIASDLVAGGDGYSTIRLGWEMTGDWYTWSGVKDPAAYVGTWRHAINAMRSVSGAHFTFDWNVSIGFANPEPMYPGDAYVDLIGADNYDSSWAWTYPASDHVQVWNHILSQNWGLNWLGSYAKAHGKRLSFPEWGEEWRCDGHGGGDDTYFMQQFHNWMASHDVAYEAVNNNDDNSCRKFSMTEGIFPNSAALYKKLSAAGPIYYGGGSTTPPPTTPPITTPPITTPPTTGGPSGTLSTSSVKASVNSDRSGAWALQGSTVSGNRYLFVSAPSNTTKVAFYLDKATSSSADRTETTGPWDFSGTAANGTAYAWNASGVGKGSHKLIVVATLSSGATQTATVTFATK